MPWPVTQHPACWYVMPSLLLSLLSSISTAELAGFLLALSLPLLPFYVSLFFSDKTFLPCLSLLLKVWCRLCAATLVPQAEPRGHSWVPTECDPALLWDRQAVASPSPMSGAPTLPPSAQTPSTPHGVSTSPPSSPSSIPGFSPVWRNDVSLFTKKAKKHFRHSWRPPCLPEGRKVMLLEYSRIFCVY